MRVALLTEAFSRRMGYLENSLPKYLTRLGVETHVVTMDLAPYYYQSGRSSEIFGRFLDKDVLTPGTSEQVNGFSLHVLAHERKLGLMRMIGLSEILQRLQPDVVQTTSPVGWLTLDAAIAGLSQPFKLFTGCHSTVSTFGLDANTPLFDPRRIKAICLRGLPGRLISYRTERCYAVTEDCALIARHFCGVQGQKVEVVYLGVDTDFFFPVRDRESTSKRAALRSEIGYNEKDIVCIYTGKLTQTKNALILAQTVEKLAADGHPYKALFIGSGIQQEQIQQYKNSKLLGFMEFQKLGPYYRAADIGVWPTNESTSSLDAAACGLPLVLSDGIVYRAHVEGNGLIYHMNDEKDLARTLLGLRAPTLRAQLGTAGAEKMNSRFSWRSVAERRIQDYQQALNLS